MKTMLFFLCLFSFSVVMAQNDKLLTKQDVIGREMFINDEWVRLREGPSLNDKIITSLGYGKAGVILEVSTESIVAGESNRWYRIQLPYGEIGWVWGKYRIGYTRLDKKIKGSHNESKSQHDLLQAGR